MMTFKETIPPPIDSFLKVFLNFYTLTFFREVFFDLYACYFPKNNNRKYFNVKDPFP